MFFSSLAMHHYLGPFVELLAEQLDRLQINTMATPQAETH